ncbi:hypothetical protein Dimus_023281 [Dionaea muscipula]
MEWRRKESKASDDVVGNVHQGMDSNGSRVMKITEDSSAVSGRLGGSDQETQWRLAKGKQCVRRDHSVSPRQDLKRLLSGSRFQALMDEDVGLPRSLYPMEIEAAVEKQLREVIGFPSNLII